MSATIDFYFDFGSPNAYLSYRALPDIEARIGDVFTLKPALLGGIFKATGNRSPMETNAGVPAKSAYERMEMQRFIKIHGITQFRMNPAFPINTLMMMRTAFAAQKLGVFAAYVETVFAAMWERALDMGDAATFAATLIEAQLPAEALIGLAQEPATKQALLDSTQEVIDRGGFGSPMFYVGNEAFFGKDRLREVEEEFVRQRG